MKRWVWCSLSLARKTLQLVQWKGGGEQWRGGEEQDGCGGKGGCHAQLGSSESPWQSCIAARERERERGRERGGGREGGREGGRLNRLMTLN